MNNILSSIVANKRREVDALSRLVPADTLRRQALAVTRPTLSLSQALRNSPTGIIAECKRRSPSKGEIHPMADVATIVGGYRDNGAAACSILTDTPYFGGALSDLAVARTSVDLPLLRKDFIVSPYQLYQARLYGADAVLLIAAVLSRDEIAALTDEAHLLGLEALLELHSPDELSSYIPQVDIVGVNNRDLSSFVTSTDVAIRMAELLPDEALKIAESGIRSLADVERLRAAGYQGFLIGETFMKTADPGRALKDFINGI